MTTNGHTDEIFCPKCGTGASRQAAFCHQCGQELGITTPMPAVEHGAPQSEFELVRSALAEDYDVKERIGRGGMAAVYRAYERSLKREVAIKVLPITQTHDTSLVERFENEARTSARLEHPNIIPIYRVGRAGNVIYFAMRYLRGPSLAELIDEMGAMETQEIRRILIESAQALGYAHQHGVVHRDVKPDNIMFKDSGQLVMCDFGIAKAATATNLTGTGTAIGTPHYMSPEQLRALPIDGRSDLYSLGVVAFKCLAKKVPFDGEDSFAIGYKHVTEEVPIPAMKTSEQRALFQVIQRLMAKDPDDRYQTADELIAALSKQSVTSVVMAALSTGNTPGPNPAFGARAKASARRADRELSGTTPHTPVPHAALQSLEPRRRKKTKRRIGVLAGMLFIMMVGGAGGGGYYYAERGDTPAIVEQVPFLAQQWPLFVAQLEAMGLPVERAQHSSPDSTTLVALLPTDSAVLPVDSSVLLGDSLPVPDSASVDSVALAAAAVVSDSSESMPDTTTAEPPSPNTGHLVVSNMGRRASLWIDGAEVRGLRHDLPPGDHEVRVASPGFTAYTATVGVVAGDTVRHRVNLEARNQCERFDSAGYNLGSACFDVRPRPGRSVGTFVPLDASVSTRPTRPAILNIQVQADGTAARIMVQSPSDVPAFALLAVQYAKNLQYEPATKNGRPVVGWVQLPFYPER
jgi:serine/threonine protein kinase